MLFCETKNSSVGKLVSSVQNFLDTFLIIAIIGASEAHQRSPSLIDKIKIFRSSQSQLPDTAYTPPSGPITRPVFGIFRVALFSKESL